MAKESNIAAKYSRRADDNRAKPFTPLTNLSTAETETQRWVDAINDRIERVYDAGGKVDDAFFMAVAAYLSRLNMEQDHGGPFGALIVRYKENGRPEVVGIGANHVFPEGNPTAHAEMEAYRDAAKRLESSDLKDMTLFTSCECCPMCLSVANGAGIGRIVYANTRKQAEQIAGFSDRLQYDMFKLDRNKLMTKAGEAERKDLEATLGSADAMIVDEKGNAITRAGAQTSADPTGSASLQALVAACRHADNHGHYYLPDGYKLISRDIPRPETLVAMDWARTLRAQGLPDDPRTDSQEFRPDRIIHLTDKFEELYVQNTGKQMEIRQPANITYAQPSLPDEKRAIRTESFEGHELTHDKGNPRLRSGAAPDVFYRWDRKMNQSNERY